MYKKGMKITKGIICALICALFLQTTAFATDVHDVNKQETSESFYSEESVQQESSTEIALEETDFFIEENTVNVNPSEVVESEVGEEETITKKGSVDEVEGGIEKKISSNAVKVDIDSDNGLVNVEINTSNIENALSISNVGVPIWTEVNGQDDIIWHSAKKKNDEIWYITVGLENYKYACGKYNIHTYVYFDDGTNRCIDQKDIEINIEPKAQLDISINNEQSGLEVRLSNIAYTDVERVAFPVWTEKNGQDDIVWHIAEKKNNSTYEAYIDIKNHKGETGKYIVHSYIYEKNGTAKFIMSESAQISPIVAATGVQIIDKNDGTGDFRAQVINVQSPAEVTNLRFAVWSAKNGQDDIKWYEGNHAGNVWYADVKAENHNNESGKYFIHCYAYDSRGVQQLLCMEERDIKVSVEERLTVSVNKAQSKILVILSGKEYGKEVTQVAFPVWTEKNGQDDIVWHIAEKKSNSQYEAEIDIRNHKSENGKYIIHAYKYKGNEPEFIKSAECDIAGMNAATGIQLIDQNTAAGKFRAQIINVQSPAKVTNVRFAVWSSENGQDDLKWYEASHSGNVWYADIEAANHNYVSGKYEIHCYSYDSRGMYQLLSTATKQLNITQKTGFFRGSDGNTYYTHKDGSLAKGWTTISGKRYYFDSTTGAMQVGWRYIEGYKLYFGNDGVLVENVDPIIGKQSRYYVKVNTYTNTVTIFAKDGANGYIIPVKKMVCSTGKAATPTIKGSYTIRRYGRWATLMGPVYGQYCSQIYGGYLFHSAWYYVNGNNRTLSVSEYKKLGNNASHGCVRLTVGDAKWIYDNCNGSTVYIYSNNVDGDPFVKPGRPNPVVISGDYGYDPTDPAFN